MELYYNLKSIPTRAVLLFAKAIDVSFEMKELNPMKGEHLEEDFLKINPEHCIPLLVDGDIALSESRAILMYLADAYAKDDSYYPKDFKDRAIVNQRLFFDSANLSSRILQCYIEYPLRENKPFDVDMIPKIEDSFNILNTYLDGKDWVAGDQITIADYSIVTIVSLAEARGYDLAMHENVANWLARCKETMEDYESLNQEGQDMLVEFINSKLNESE